MSKELERAQQTLNEKRAQVNRRYKPACHPSVPAGWLNDPNGFSWFQGKVHLFYQYHPYDSVWGPMHWGHWVSEDLVNWQEMPVAMAPDTNADIGGCFSGSALIENDEMVLIYTGLSPKDETDRHFQQQCMAVCRDGVHVEKYEHNPIIDRSHLPEGADPYDFRDPKIQKKDGSYRVVAASKGETHGQLLAYRSDDLKNWKLSGVYADQFGGFMAECPEVFEVGGKTAVIVCVMGADQTKYPCRQPVVYMVGDDVNDQLISSGDPIVLDWGLDFYAPQVTRLPDGRQIMIGWALSWGHVSPAHTLGHGWAGTMTLPREMTLDANGQLCQKPVEEWKKLRRDEVCLENVKVGEEIILSELAGDKREMVLDVDMTAADSFTLKLLKTGDEAFVVSYDKATGLLRTDRGQCGYPCTENFVPEEKPYGETVVPLVDGHLKLHVFVDVSIVELFADEGRKVFTSIVFPKGEDAGVSLSAQGEACAAITSWKLA